MTNQIFNVIKEIRLRRGNPKEALKSERKLKLVPCYISFMSFREQHGLVSYLLLVLWMQKVWLSLDTWMTGKCSVRNTASKESLFSPRGEQRLLHKLLCNRAASQSAALVWGERRNTSANSACCTANWPHVTAALFSSVFCFSSSWLPSFLSPVSCLMKRGLCAECWLRQQEVMWLVNPPLGCRWFYPSLSPLSDRFLSTFSPVSQRGSLPVCVCLCLLSAWEEFI